MPERMDAVLIAILTKRPLCEACLADHVGLTGEGARAALDHLNERVRVHHRNDRCHACGQVGDTMSIERR